MKVVYSERLSETHSVEIGWSTWDKNQVSLRNRYDKNGRYSPRASSEVPLSDLPELMRVALERLPEVLRAREED